jgi:regulator of RNase E activity RraB
MRYLKALLAMVIFQGCIQGVNNRTASLDLEQQKKAEMEVIAALKDNGSDLSKPHLMEHHFITYDQSDGVRLVEWGKERGFQVSKIEEGVWEGKKYFYFDLTKLRIPTVENIISDTKVMLEVASKFNCEYDGWGGSIVE